MNYTQTETIVEEKTLLDEGQTTIHCTYRASPKFDSGWWVNISRSTYLINALTNERLQIISCINVPFMPQKRYLKSKYDVLNFTLIFQKIPKDWQSFNLVETGTENNFVVKGLVRNESLVYRIIMK